MDIDYDDPNDPDVPTSGGSAVISACAFVGAIERCICSEDRQIFIWNANAPEQIEAHLSKMGWEIKRNRKWKT